MADSAQHLRDWPITVLRAEERSAVAMNSSMIGKIEKAHRYAKEPERVRVHTFQATFKGSHDDYQVGLQDGQWSCTCHAFSSHTLGTCAHVMAVQELLSSMLSTDDRYAGDSLVAAPALSLAN
jgi:hypothetical protein